MKMTGMDNLTLNTDGRVFMMVLKHTRIEVTDRVVGKLGNNEMNLYVEKEPIGKIRFTNDGAQYELKQGYEQESSKIYTYADIPSTPDMKYVDCDDENGWC
ncbi:YusG family protein [Bacillus sinesaloumensis]|uniref:YusG family protein n=1 Tax=Litchfieldia sinesaloumensis TaxID=1926280 RepID=UPI00098877F4|nr:YusG family protein [Bacillus sinesaloumensis]